MLLIGCLSLNLIGAPADNWVKIVAPQFTLYSPVKKRDAIKIAEEFQQFIDALGEVFPLDVQRLPPLTIVMFSQAKDFRGFRPSRPDGKPWDVAGFFSRREGWAVFGLAGSRLDAEVRRTIFHEGVHWYLSGSEFSSPPWLEEGLAEVFSTFAVTNNRREWGQPIVDHIETLRSSRPIPLERLLSVSHSDPLFNELRRTGLFYAESWAFTHLLLFGEHNRDRRLYNDYVRLLRSGIHPDNAFKIAFRKDFQAMDRELEEYIVAGRYFVRGRSATPRRKTLVVTPAGDAECEIALAQLALGANRIPLALHHLDRARGADADLVALNEVQGYVALAGDNTTQALQHFKKAAALGSKDSRVYFELAQHKHHAMTEAGDSITVLPAEAREVADNYEKAIALCPWLLQPYQGLGGIIGLLGGDSGKDRVILQRGRALFPSDGMIQIGLASSLHESGRLQEAVEILSAVLAGPEKYPAAVSRYARDLQQIWNFNDDCERIRRLANAGQFSEALKAIDALLATPVPQTSRAALELDRATIWVRVRLIEVDRARDDHRWRDARKVLEEIMASSASQAAKHDASLRLEEMDRHHLGRD